MDAFFCFVKENKSGFVVITSTSTTNAQLLFLIGDPVAFLDKKNKKPCQLNNTGGHQLCS